MAGTSPSHPRAGSEHRLRAALSSLRPPEPTDAFRRRAWLAFQRALDPLGEPREGPLQRWRRRRRGKAGLR